MNSGPRLGWWKKVYCRLWSDPKFLELSDGAKVFMFYVLTGPQARRIGIFRFSLATAAEDLAIDQSSACQYLQELCTTFDWRHDPKARLLWLPRFWRYNRVDNRKNLKGFLTDLQDVPDSPLVVEFAAHVEDIPPAFREFFRESLADRLVTPIGSGVPSGMASATRSAIGSSIPSTIDSGMPTDPDPDSAPELDSDPNPKSDPEQNIGPRHTAAPLTPLQTEQSDQRARSIRAGANGGDPARHRQMVSLKTVGEGPTIQERLAALRRRLDSQ